MKIVSNIFVNIYIYGPAYVSISIDLHMCHSDSFCVHADSCVKFCLNSHFWITKLPRTPWCNGPLGRTMLGQMPWRPCSNASGRVLRVIQRSWRLSGCCQRSTEFSDFFGGLLEVGWGLKSLGIGMIHSEATGGKFFRRTFSTVLILINQKR